MMHFYKYKFTLWKNHKKKLVFCSTNNHNLKIEVSKSERSKDERSELQKIQFDSTSSLMEFTIKKRFTLDWHTRPNSILSEKIAKNQKFLKVASFYAQLHSRDFSKKFSSLVILKLNLKTKAQSAKNLTQKNSTEFNYNNYNKHTSNINIINKIPNRTTKMSPMFSNFQSKLWFSNIFMPFSNRNYWWILLPTQSILTHICCQVFFKRITNLFQISLHSRSAKDSLNSNILFTILPEFLIEKPIYWYCILPFVGCIGLLSDNINLSFFAFENSFSTLDFKKKVDCNIYSTFSQYQINNSISWEMFQFFDYKKILFDSSLKYINQLFLNSDTLFIQMKKTWLSRQKEHYICYYQDNLIQKKINKNWNQINQLTMIYWWKRNWEKILYVKDSSLWNFINIENSVLSNFKKEKYLRNNLNLNIPHRAQYKQFYSFESLLYSTFYWYWYQLDTKNINPFLNRNFANIISQNKNNGAKRNNSKLDFQKVLSNSNATLLYPLSQTQLLNNFLISIPKNLTSSSNYYFSINEFPLKIQLPWLSNELYNDKIGQNRMELDSLCSTSKSVVYQQLDSDSMIKIIDNNQIPFLDGIDNSIKKHNDKNNNKKNQKKLIEFQIQQFNLKFKKILDYNFLKNNNLINDASLNRQNNIISSFPLIFCISAKNQTMVKYNKILNNRAQVDSAAQTQRDKNKQYFDNLLLNSLLKNRKKLFLKLTLYSGIGCEIFESEFNPIYGWKDGAQRNFNIKKKIYSYKKRNNSIQNHFTKYHFQNQKEYNNNNIKPNNVSNIFQIQNNNKKWNKNNLNTNQSISSFNKASLLLNNIISKLYFESGVTWLTTQYFINNFYNILNINNNKISLTSIDKKTIQMYKKPILMSGYNLPQLNSILLEKNRIFKDLSNSIIKNQIRCNLPPNSFSNQDKFNNFLKWNKTEYIKSNQSQLSLLTHFGSSYSSLVKKQSLSILKKKFKKIDTKLKKFERFLILSLLKNTTNFKTLLINIKKIQYNQQFFNKKTNSKYQTIRSNDLINNKSFDKIVKNKSNFTDKEHIVSFLLRYSNSIIKNQINLINSTLPHPVFSNKIQTNLLSSLFSSNATLSLIKMEQKRIFTSLNWRNLPKYFYVPNQSIFWSYINSTYNSSGLLETNKPFIFEKLNNLRKNIRLNSDNRNNTIIQNWPFFSNFLLQKYQRKSKNWLFSTEPQGFFYKRINKLNFKQIQKKHSIERSEKLKNSEVGDMLILQSNKFKQFKNISKFKPIGELLWEVRTKHKIPEVLLIQQTLFFQKKLVRKSTEENTVVNPYSSTDEGLSQKMQTLIRKMTQRRYFRKHVFLDTLFAWTRDAISLKKMLRKIYFKNNWQIFLKYILKSKNNFISSDSFSNWYKNYFYNSVFIKNNKKFIKQNGSSAYFNIIFNINFKKMFKTENSRSFFYKLSKTQNNKKLLQSPNKIHFFLKYFYKKLNVEQGEDFYLLQSLINKKFCNNLKKNKKIYNKKFKNLYFYSLKELNSVMNNSLILPEWQIFNYFALSNGFIPTQFESLINKKDNINSLSSSSLINNFDKNLFINRLSTTQENSLSNVNGLSSYHFINQRNLSKICSPLYAMSNNNKNKKWDNQKGINEKSPIYFNFTLSLPIYFNKNLLNSKQSEFENYYKTKFQSKKQNSLFMLNLGNIFNHFIYFKILQYKNSNKFFEIYNNQSDFLQTKPLEKNLLHLKWNNYSNQLSIRNRLLYQKLYFNNIFWHSTDFILNTNSMLFTENQLIKNPLTQNWVFQIRPMDFLNFFDRGFNLTFHNLLSTLSIWQYKFQIRRDLILQIFYIYLDHAGAFLNYVIQNLILDNIVNQIQNWDFLGNILIKKEPIKQNTFYLEKYCLTQPTWSFDLLNHIKIQYPNFYNQIQIINQSNFNKIQSNLTQFNTLIKTPELQSKKQVIFSPNLKTQLPLINAFQKNSGRNRQFFQSYNIFSNFDINCINVKDHSIIHKLSSQSLIIQNSTLLCQKWIQNRQLSNFNKIQFLKKQRKLKQILNILQNNVTFDDATKQNKKIISMGFKRRSGFLLTRSLITKNFNSFSSFSKVTRAFISVYLNKNSETISINNFLFLSQILLLHICLIFCLITFYQSAFHFCLKSSISLFVIFVHYFLNIKYRLQRLIKYVYQSIAQSFLTNIQENWNSVNSLHRQFFVFLNNLSTLIFYNKFVIWGKTYKSSIPSLTHFLFQSPFANHFILKFVLKSKNLMSNEASKIDLVLSENSSNFFKLNNLKIKKLNYLKSFFKDIKSSEIKKKSELNWQLDLIPKKNLLKIISQKKENIRMSLLRNTNIIQKAAFAQLQNPIFLIPNQIEPITNTLLSPSSLPWENTNSNPIHLKRTKKEKIKNIKTKKSSTLQLSLKLFKWNLGLILLIGESEIFAELEPYREMHWYFLKRLPIFLRSNTYVEDPINMYDYQADEKLRKFKEQFKKATEIFQKRQNIIEKKTERNFKKESVDGVGTHIERRQIQNSGEQQIEQSGIELINKKYPDNNNFLKKQNNKNAENIILFIKSEKQLKEKSIKLLNIKYINKIKYLLNNFYFLRKKISRGQPFWKPLFAFLGHTLFVSRLSKLNRRFRDSLLIINYIWIPFGPLTTILCSFLWKNGVLNFSNLLNFKNPNSFQLSTKKYKIIDTFDSSFLFIPSLSSWINCFKQNNSIMNLNKLQVLDILKYQEKWNHMAALDKKTAFYCSPFKVNRLDPAERDNINNFESKVYLQEIKKIFENINIQNTTFSQLAPPLFNRVFLWNFVKFENKYQRAILKFINIKEGKENQALINFNKFYYNYNNYNKEYLNFENSNIDKDFLYVTSKYKSIYINNQEQSAQNRYIHYQTYDPKVRLYRFYTNFSKNLHDIGIIQDAKNVHPIFGSLFCEIYSGLLSSTTKGRKQFSDLYYNTLPKQLSFFSSTKNILLVGNTNSSNFVLLVQAFAAETGLKLFMEDAKRLRRLGRRGINKSTKRLEKLFEIAQAHSPCIVFLEDIDVIGSKRRVIKINEEDEDEDMVIRSFFSKLIYRKQHNYKSLNQSFIHQNLFINQGEGYRNTQKSILPESPIPSNLIEYQLTRRKAYSNYFSNTSTSSYKSFITKLNALKKVSSINGNFSNNVPSSPTNTVIIWKLLKSKLVTPKKTIKEAPWKHIPVDSMRSIPLITYSIRVKVAKLTMLAIYTMNTQLRLVKDLIKLLEKVQYESYKGFIVFATTNKLALLDPSLRRPGRFDETIYLPSLTVNPDYQRFSAIHFLNILSIDSKDFVNFSRTFNIINSMNFAINWNINSVYGNVFIQDNSEKIFYPTRTSLRDLINSTAGNVYNQNIFMQNENNIYQSLIPFDIWGNIGFQKPNFSIYLKSSLLLSLAYSKAGQLLIQLYFEEKSYGKKDYNIQLTKIVNQLPFNSENNQLIIWPNSNLFTQLKKINISYISQNKNIKKFLIHFFAGKIGEFCFFSFYKNTQNNIMSSAAKEMNTTKKIQFNHLFEKNSFGVRSLYGIQPNWKNANSVIFSLIRSSCFYSKNHFTSKLFYLDDIFKKRQRIFSENLGPSLLFEYFNLNTESFLKRNTITLEDHLQKQQTQKYLLNLQKKPLRKFLFDSAKITISKNNSYLNKIYNQNILLTDHKQKQNSARLALFQILFNELGSLENITLRPTAMNYFYDKKIYYKQRFRKYTYKWWNWHFKKTIDSLEEFQYLNFFPYADKQYNPRRQRWMLTNGYSAYWLAQEKILYYQIYEQLIIECFQRSYLQLDKHREMLDYLVQLLMTKQLLTEIQWILFFKRFI